MNKESLGGKLALEDALFDYEKLKHFLTDRIPVEIMLWKDKIMKNRSDAFAYSMVGMLSLHINEYNEAMKYLYKPIELEPENARHWEQLAFAHEKQVNILRAIDYYKTVLQKDYKRIGTLLHLAKCYSLLCKRGNW